VNGRILVAGVGNIFLGDDAFGVEVVRRLAGRPLPAGVEVVDFGIRGLDLTYALLEPYAAVIIVDAASRGGAPGTLYVIEPEWDESAAPISLTAELHALDPAKVLRLARSMGGTIKKIFVVGCEPQLRAEDDDFGVALSSPVQAAVEEAVSLIESLVANLRSASPFSARPEVPATGCSP
jgi:hydrogenase maturation protease